jgi:hypothetical protein
MSWTTNALKVFLDEKGIPQNAYSLYADRDEAYCLDKVGSEWLVYYSERGNRSELAWGKSEAQALDVLKLYLLEAFRKI